MPLTPLQRNILRLIAENRTPESYVAGGAVLNATGGRFSADIDLFSDRAEALARAVEADAEAIRGAGLDVQWMAQGSGFHRAVISDSRSSTRLDWAVDSDFRFYPTQRDQRFGYVLHPVDLATNKLLAAEGRNEVRDSIDLMTTAGTILPLGANAWAAAAKSPGLTPDGLIRSLRRRARFTEAHLSQERLSESLAAAELNTWIRNACDAARAWLETVPSEFEFGLFVDEQGRPGAPDFVRSGAAGWQIHAGSRGGAWPSSPEMSGEMIRAAVSDQRASDPEG